jgi:hypothetical protein
MDTGDKKGFQIQISDLERAGVAFGKTVNALLNHSDSQSMTLQNFSDLFTKQDLPSSGNSSLNNTPKRTRKMKKPNTKTDIGRKKGADKRSEKVSIENDMEKELSGCSSDDDDDDGE